MNGRALQKEFGGFPAKTIFRKMGWEFTDIATAATSTSQQGKTTGFANKTSELVEKWKTNTSKKCRHPNTDEELSDKPEKKMKKIRDDSDIKE